MKNKIIGLRPIIWTHDLNESMHFYTEILGFTVAEYNETWQWASLYNGEIELMLSKFNEHSLVKKATFTGSFYFNVLDVEASWNSLKNKAKICYEIESFDWGMREFAIYDTNGYILQFGQEI